MNGSTHFNWSRVGLGTGCFGSGILAFVTGDIFWFLPFMITFGILGFDLIREWVNRRSE